MKGFQQIGSVAAKLVAEAGKNMAARASESRTEFVGGPTVGGVPVEPPTLGSTRATASSDGKGKVADAETPAKCDQMGDNRRVKHRSRPVLLVVNNRDGRAVPNRASPGPTARPSLMLVDNIRHAQAPS